MASIASLLNPQPEKPERHYQLPTPCSNRFTRREYNSPPARQKKQKISKDAAIFTRGRIRGELRYPPCEYQNKELAEAHRALEIHPMGHIKEFPRHIPYNSEKKSFLEKTGRESFEVFQYTFRLPNDDKTYTVMWDYNIGLVRTTSFFRCNNYSKTAPAKMLNANPGLREICHSITGGALAAQGYWMPFEAAKAVAATFCWNIRYALTPLFGVEFLSLCIPPGDPGYGRMIIDPAIVRSATASAKHYRLLEQKSAATAIPKELPSAYARPTSKPERWNSAKNLKLKPIAGPEENSNDYTNDTDMSESCCFSPQSPHGNNWTPANTPQTPRQAQKPVPSPKDILASLSNLQNKAGEDEEDAEVESISSTEATPTERLPPESDAEYNADDDSHAILSDAGESSHASITRRHSPLPLTNDARAAYMLLKLRVQDVVTGEEDQKRKRRNST